MSTKEKTEAITIRAVNGLGAAHYKDIPVNSRITRTVDPSGKNEEYGFFLRSDEHGKPGYQVRISASEPSG